MLARSPVAGKAAGIWLGATTTPVDVDDPAPPAGREPGASVGAV